jgi:hypothetical protein
VTRGIAQYRLGQFTEALESLSRADTAGIPRDAASEAPRLAFLAMAEYRVGRKDRAAAALERYRDVLRRTARSGGEEAIALRREVEQLVEPGPATRSLTAPARE